MANAMQVRKKKRTREEWLENIVKEHGDTEPVKLEQRRNKLSALLASVEETLRTMQMYKKNRDKELADQLAAAHRQLEKMDEGQDRQQFQNEVFRLEQAIRAEEMSNAISISNMTCQLATLEALTQIIDSNTIRVECRVKGTRATGTTRYTTPGYLAEIGWSLHLLRMAVFEKLGIEFNEDDEDVMPEADMDEVVLRGRKD